MNLKQMRECACASEAQASSTKFDVPTGTVLRMRVKPRDVPAGVMDLGGHIGETRSGLRHMYFTLECERGAYAGVTVYASLALESSMQPAYDRMPHNARYAVQLSEVAWVRAFESAAHFRNVQIPDSVTPQDLFDCEVCVQIGHTQNAGKQYKIAKAWLSHATVDIDLATAWRAIIAGAYEVAPAGVQPVQAQPANGWAQAQSAQAQGGAWAQAQPAQAQGGAWAQAQPAQAQGGAWAQAEPAQDDIPF